METGNGAGTMKKYLIEVNEEQARIIKRSVE